VDSKLLLIYTFNFISSNARAGLLGSCTILYVPDFVEE